MNKATSLFLAIQLPLAVWVSIQLALARKRAKTFALWLFEPACFWLEQRICMFAVRQTDYAKGIRSMPIPNGSELVSIRLEYSLVAALAAADVIEFGFLPQDCVPDSYFIDNDDLDSGTTITADFGLLTAAGTAVSALTADGGAKWLTASTALQAAGLTNPSGVAHTRCTPDATTARKVGMVIVAGPSTATTGKIGVTFRYRSAAYNG